MSTSSGAAADIGAHPIYTALGAFYVRTASDVIVLQNAPTLVFDAPVPRSSSGCVPPSLAAYETDPEAWKPENRDSLKCRHMTLLPLPIGTAMQVDSVVKTWDFDNGTRYLISAHLLDPGLPQRSFEIESYILGRQSGTLRLDPQYFIAEPPKSAQPQ